jgi:hypothetical protein
MCKKNYTSFICNLANILINQPIVTYHSHAAIIIIMS